MLSLFLKYFTKKTRTFRLTGENRNEGDYSTADPYYC